MKKMMKYVGILAISLTLPLGHLLADGSEKGKRDRPGQERHRGEVRKYIEEKITPVMKEQRASFDAKLSAADKTAIANARQQLKQSREEGKKLRAAFNEAAEGKRELTTAEKTAMADIRLALEKALRQVREIAQSHSELLEETFEQLAPQRKTWRSDIKALMDKNGKKTGEKKEGEKRTHENRRHWKGTDGKDGRKGRMKGHGHRGGHWGGAFLGHSMRPVGFLLMDPAETPAQGNEAPVGPSAYPNPAVSSNKLVFNVKEAGKVEINLYDRQGNLVKKVFEGEKTAGEHEVETNTEGLNEGVYIYKITTPAGTQNKRISVRK